MDVLRGRRAGESEDEREDHREHREPGEQQDQRPNRRPLGSLTRLAAALLWRDDEGLGTRAGTVRIRLDEAGLELRRELVHRREAPARVLRHRALDRGVEARRDVRPRLAHAGHRLVDVLHRDRDEVLPAERQLARQIAQDGSDLDTFTVTK